jgi:hypothetical protein
MSCTLYIFWPCSVKASFEAAKMPRHHGQKLQVHPASALSFYHCTLIQHIQNAMEKVQFQLEATLPELKDLHEKGLFSKVS